MVIKQAWWHIEDKRKPSEGVMFRQVTDIHTDQQFITCKITNYFVKLKIKSRFKGQELNFLQSGEYIRINLGNLIEDWPPAYDYHDKTKENIRHVRLEIEYIDIKPKLDNILFLDTIPRLGYETTHDINGITQPEFYISVPLGMKMKNGGKNAKLLLKRKFDGKDDKRRMYFEEVHIDHVDGRNAYYFLISEESYKLLRSTKAKDIKSIKINYSVTNQFKFWFMPIFPILLILLGVISFITNITATGAYQYYYSSYKFRISYNFYFIFNILYHFT